MSTKLLFITILLFLSSKTFGQEEMKIAEKHGVKISYQLILKDEGKKKDKYILIVNAINDSENNLYYTVPLTQNEEGNWELPYLNEDKGFTKLKVRNTVGIFGGGQSIIGDQTKYKTTENALLFELKSGNIYTYETTFKVKSGVKPIITNSFLKSLKTVDAFDLKASTKMLNGDYISDCGNFKMNLLMQNTIEHGEHLLQTTNGHQFIWVRLSETTFTRENRPEDYSLTFNKSNNTYTYSTSDGVTCIWTKE